MRRVQRERDLADKILEALLFSAKHSVQHV
jgi:hypothetical protein